MRGCSTPANAVWADQIDLQPGMGRGCGMVLGLTRNLELLRTRKELARSVEESKDRGIYGSIKDEKKSV